MKKSGFLANELRVTIYCTSHELLFTYESRVSDSWSNYEFFLLLTSKVCLWIVKLTQNLSRASNYKRRSPSNKKKRIAIHLELIFSKQFYAVFSSHLLLSNRYLKKTKVNSEKLDYCFKDTHREKAPLNKITRLQKVWIWTSR